MKRRTKKTFFELKVTLFFDLFDFWIGGYYDYKKKALYLALIPTLVIKLEKAPNVAILNAIGDLDKGKKEGKTFSDKLAKFAKDTEQKIELSISNIDKAKATGGIISKSKGAVI